MSARIRPALKPAIKALPPQKQKLRTWLRLLRTTRQIEAELRLRLREQFATTLPRFDVLAALARAPEGLTMTALSRALIVSNGNATVLVDALVKERLVVRVADTADRRATFVRLTRKGESEFERMASEHAQWIEQLFGDLDGDACAQLDHLLTRCTPKLAETTP
jgi:DNA-binding MarR family transcriptional regulator